MDKLTTRTTIASSIIGICASSTAIAAPLKMIEEVTVTATKREQNLADVPASVSAVSQKKMESLGLTDSFDLSNHTAGLTIAGTNRQAKPQIFIRGVGNSDFQTGSSSPVASYANGVYQGANFSLAASLIDLNRVEVLKGPQGTLWGRNTTAGLINYVPNQDRPGDELNGRVALSYDDQGELNIDGAIGGSFSDKVAGRIAINYNDRDGVFKAESPTFSDSEFGGGDSTAVRANLIYEPKDELTFSLTVNYSDFDANMNPTKSLGLVPPDGTTSCSRPGMLRTSCASPNFSPFETVFVSDRDSNTVEPQFDSFEKIESSGIALQVDYDFPTITLTSLTAINDGERTGFDDTDGSPIDGLETSYDDEYSAFSQELRLTSNNDGEFNWILGFYYYTDELEFYRGAVLPYFTSFANALAQKVDTETYAIFGEANWDLTEKLTLTAGLRWTSDEREAEANIFTFNANVNRFNDLSAAQSNFVTPIVVGDTIDETFREPSGRISLMYALTNEINLWAAIGRGFKGGDSNSGAESREQFSIADPEFLTSFEVGLKGTLLDSSLQFDISAYIYDYKDKQVFTEVAVPGGNTVTTLSNAGELTIQGIDLTATWFPTENFFIDAGLAYTDAEFDEFLSATAGDLSGGTTAYTPEFSFNFITGYSWHLSNESTISLQVDGVWSDDQFFTNNNQDIVGQESYWLWGGSIAYTTADEAIEVRLWTKNAGDEEYIVGSFEFIGNVIAYPGDPQSTGITVSYSF